MILSNNRIESGLILNLSCVPGSVLDFNVAHGPPRKTFFSKLLEHFPPWRNRNGVPLPWQIMIYVEG